MHAVACMYVGMAGVVRHLEQYHLHGSCPATACGLCMKTVDDGWMLVCEERDVCCYRARRTCGPVILQSRTYAHVQAALYIALPPSEVNT
eukprot:214894-Chlamydomonas_euryale.AAC.4